MSNHKSLIAVLVVVVLVFVGLIVAIPHLSSSDSSEDAYNVDSIDVSKVDPFTVLKASSMNGNIADHIKGKESSPVTIFEYADYQCSGCANVNPWINELLKEYDGKLRIVFRVYPLVNGHPNAIAAASAVEAAGLQGYWEEYGNLIFANQAEWFYLTGTERTNIFMEYFTSLTNGEGDLVKFRQDLASSAVKQKVYFDKAISESLEISATPTFLGEDGEELEWVTDNRQTKDDILDFFRDYIDQKLKEKVNK